MSSGRGWLAEALPGSEASRTATSGDTPPLSSWIATALIVLVVLTPSLVSFARHKDDAARERIAGFVAYNAPRVSAFAEQEQGAATYRVIGLGDSRLKFATLPAPAMARLAERHGLPDFRFLRITENEGLWDSFIDLEDSLLASRPDLVLIQLDLAARERILPSLFTQYRRYLRGWMRDLVLPTPPRPPRDHHAVQFRTDCQHHMAPAGLWSWVTQFEARLQVNPDSAHFASVIDFARRARQAGAEVALLEVHSSPELRAHYRGTRLDDQPVLDRLREQPEVAVWPFPPELSVSENYCDFLHLGEAAREHYAAWLIARIAASARAD